MNLMTVVICLCMNRPYQSYYFVPLVTFWYIVVYLTLVLPPQITASLCDTKPISYLYIILKFVGLFTCITILYMSEVFFENIFLTRPWKALFVTPDDQVHEWWFRWSLDRYRYALLHPPLSGIILTHFSLIIRSICFGLVFGFLYVSAQKYGLLDDSVSTNLWQRGKTAFVAFVSLAGIGGYTAFTFTCQKKPECNEVHPYIAFVPVGQTIF
jgi:N-acetylneuraminate 9-O-acetyltransferase